MSYHIIILVRGPQTSHHDNTLNRWTSDLQSYCLTTALSWTPGAQGIVLLLRFRQRQIAVITQGPGLRWRCSIITLHWIHVPLAPVHRIEEMSHSENAAALLSQLRFQNASAISKRICDFKTQLRFQKRICDFKTQLRFQNAAASTRPLGTCSANVIARGFI